MLPAPAACLPGYRARKELPLVRICTPFRGPVGILLGPEIVRVQTHKLDGSREIRCTVLSGYFNYYIRLFKVL